MDVKTVCLGMLSDGPATGYDLKKQFESSFAHFFAAGFGSIYPALSSLAEQELVDCERVPQDGKPDRKVYEITKAGREFLGRALENSSPAHKVRSEFLATVCFSHLMSREQCDSIVDHRLQDLEQILNTLRQAESNCLDDMQPGMRFVVGVGRAVSEAMMKYVEENRHLLVTESK